MKRLALIPALCLMLGACQQEQVEQAADTVGNTIQGAGEKVANKLDDMGGDVIGAINETAAGAVHRITARPTDKWIGKWTGVEGLALDIGQGEAPGKYALKISLMDGANDYEGTADGKAIRFTRDGKTELIHEATGDETGLKWLAGKKDCLMIKEGEGFCRG